MKYQEISQGVLGRDPVDPGPGKHLWMITMGFRIPDDTLRDMAAGRPAEGVLLDHENLILAAAPGCFKCERPFSRYLFHRKCTGDMKEMQS